MRREWQLNRDRRQLFRLAPIESCAMQDVSIEGRRRLVAELLAICNAEEARGRRGSWAYSKPQHSALINNLKTEHAELAALMTGEGLVPPVIRFRQTPLPWSG